MSNKKIIIILAIMVLASIFLLYYVYMDNMLKKYDFQNLYMYCDYGYGTDPYDRLGLHMRNWGELEHDGSSVFNGKKVKITKLENYIYIGMLKDLSEKYSDKREEFIDDYSNYIVLQDSEQGTIFEVQYPRGEHLAAFLIFFGFYLRTFYPYVFLVWLILGFICIVSTKKAVQKYGEKQILLPKLHFFIISLAVMILFDKLKFIWQNMRVIMNDLLNIESHGPRFVNIYAMITVGIIQAAFICLSSGAQKAKKTVAYILPTVLAYAIIYFRYDIYRRFIYLDIFNTIYRSLYLVSQIRGHYLMFYDTILLIPIFIIYYLFLRIAHKPKDRVLWSMVYSFCTVLTTAFPVFFAA